MLDLPSHMDFDGQRRAEKYFQTIIIVFALAGLVWGYVVEQFSLTVYTLAGGFVVASLLTLPPWGIYRRKPLNWQKPKNPEDSPQGSSKPKKKK